MAPHSSTLAWRVPWTEEPSGLQSMGSLRVGHNWVTSLSFFIFMHWRRKWLPTPVFLPGESHGWGSLVGCRLWDRTVGHDWSDLAAAAWLSGKESTCQCRRHRRCGFDLWDGKIPWRRAWQPTPVFHRIEQTLIRLKQLSSKLKKKKKLICNVVLVSSIRQIDSVIHIHLLLLLFSH